MRDDLPIDAYQKKLGTELNKLSTKKRICLFADENCNSKFIKAHSIPESALRKITDEMKNVYQIKILENAEFDDIHKYSTIRPKKIPVSKISTFNGFCSFHDKEVFRFIEDEEIIPTELQIFLLCFRTVAYNHYSKISGEEILDAFLNADLPGYIDVSDVLNMISNGKEPMKNVKLQISNELSMYKNAIEGKFTPQINTLFFRIEQIPEIMCCETFSPTFDLGGNSLLEYSSPDGPIQNFILNISCDKKSGFIQISWQAEYQIINQFIKQLLKNENYINKLICMIFYKSHNYAFSIEWWDNLSISKKKALMKYYSFTHKQMNENDVFKEISEDHKKYVNWKITENINEYH